MTISLSIPDEVKILVTVGEKVDLKTKIFEQPTKELVKINIAKKLDIKPENIFQSLKKFVNEKIKKGEKIAYKKTFFSKKYVFSDYEGVLKEINHQTGEIVIEIDSSNIKEKKVFFSPVIGEIQQIEKNRIKFKVKKKEEIEIKPKSSKTFGAEIFILEKNDQIIAENIEKRLVVTESLDLISQIKCEALGAFGFLTLKKLVNLSELLVFQFKNLEDIKKIKSKNFSYCFIENNSDKIIFYE